MPNPSIPNFKGEIKTPWRWYNSEHLLSENQRACADTLRSCPFKLIWRSDSLPPFQVVTPFSMLPVTAWGLYDANGDQVVNLIEVIHLITYEHAQGYDYLIYNADALGIELEPGTYYARLSRGNVEYFSEPFTVACKAYLDNAFQADPFDNGLFSDINGEAIWSLTAWGRILAGTKNTAGDPTDPALGVEGNQVANFGDDLLYTYESGSWVSSTPGTATGWYDLASGNWYRYTGTSWQGLASDPITIDGNGIQWSGDISGMGPGVSAVIGDISCVDKYVRVAFTVEGWTEGSVIAGTDEGSVTANGNGEYSVVVLVTESTVFTFTGINGFDGTITTFEVLCPVEMEECYSRLTWTNCGNVGNTHMGGGFTHQFWLDQAIYPVTPNPEVIIEEKEQADGSVLVESRRKETTWTIQLGFVPWFIADALTDMAIYDEIRFHTVGGGNDRLAQGKTRVQVDWIEDYGECMADVTISFQIDSATVACCDDFDPPCRESCGNVRGVSDEGGLVEGLVYAIANRSEYGTFADPGFTGVTACESGIITVVDAEDLIIYTLIFDLNLNLWRFLAQVTDLDVFPNGDGCDVVIQATIKGGYSGILQYLDADDVWQDDTQVDLSAEDWLTNTIRRETPADESSTKALRIRVYIDDCTIGYSEVSNYACD
jgi:hypothetical protein